MHSIVHKKKLIARVRRVRGQVEAVERALEAERGCDHVVHAVIAARGALNSLAAELLCEHLEAHVGAPEVPDAERTEAAGELSRIIRRLVS
ncbi:MAG: metal/formaldehyde-sensitive transcriptional repressor [Polyangiales bacterium]